MKKRTNILLLTALGTLLLTACNEDELMQNNTPATGTRGSLHVTEVTLPEGGMQSRVATDGGSSATTNSLVYNQAFVGFENGDEIGVTYRFTEMGTDSEAELSYNGTAWSFTATDARPNGGDESWEHFTMTASLALSTSDYQQITEEVTGVTLFDDFSAESTDARMYLDKLVASTEEGGGITADTEVTSPTLGSFRVALKHAHAMLRLPKSAITMEELIVEGQEITPTFKTLWAELSYTEGSKMYIPLTEVGNHYQAIVPVEENGAAVTLTGFQMVYTDGEEGNTPYTHVFDLGDGAVALAANTHYPLTLTLGPRKTEVTLTAPTGKPGWSEDESELDNSMNEAVNEVTYTAGTFTISGPNGLQLVNKWMTGSLDDAAYDFLTASYNWPSNDQATRLKQNITLAEDITLPATDLTTGEPITVDTSGKPSGSNWIPLGGSTAYSGTFNGNDKSITGLRIVSNANSVGLVNILGSGGEVSSLTLTDAVVHSTSTYTDVGRNSVGLIAGLNNGYVNSCNVSGSSVKGMYYVGGIVGTNNETVTGCIVEYGSSATGMKYVGGIVGMNNETVVSSCINRGSATATGYSGDDKYCYAGGIVGINNGGTVSGCNNESLDESRIATVTSDYYAGGIAGENIAGGTVSESTNSGSVESTSTTGEIYEVAAGGIVGYNFGTNSSGVASSIIVCGDWGTVTSKQSAGGIVGYYSYGTATACWTTQNKAIGLNGGTTTACYYQGSQDGDEKWYGTGVESVNTEDVVNAMNIAIAIWNAANTSNTVLMGWQVGTHYSYPDMEAISNITNFPTKVGNFYQVGEKYYNADGVEVTGYTMTNGTFTISGDNATALQLWGALVNAGNLSLNLTLEADITLPTEGITLDENGIPSGSNWTPVGDLNNRYTGTIDGGGHTITGLRISSTSDYTGLVGYMTGGTVKNLTLNDAVVHSTAYYTGGIVGNTFKGTVSGCTVSGTVTGTNYVGGIAGRNSSGTITACGNTATVTGESYVGGIVGYSSATLIACWTIDTNEKDNNGNEVSNRKDGIGYNSGTITACYVFADASAATTQDTEGKTPIDYMNTAISTWNGTEGNTAVTWNWQAGTDDNWPTLVSTAGTN